MEESTVSVWLSGALAVIACSSAFILSLQRTWLHKSQQTDLAPLRFDTQRDYTQHVADDAHRLTRISFSTLVLTVLSGLNVYHVVSDDQPWALSAAAVAQFISWLYATVLVLVSRRHKFPSDWGWILNVHLFIFYLVSWLIAFYNVYLAIVLKPDENWISMVPTVIGMLLVTDLVYTTSTASRGAPFLDEQGRKVAPVNVASIFSILYFDWVAPLVHLAYKKQTLTDEDLPTLPPLFRGYNLYYIFGATRGNSILKRIYMTNRTAIVVQIVLAVVTSLGYYVPAYFVNQLLRLIQSMDGKEDTESMRRGFIIVASLGASIFILGIAVGQLWYYGKLYKIKVVQHHIHFLFSFFLLTSQSQGHVKY